MSLALVPCTFQSPVQGPDALHEGLGKRDQLTPRIVARIVTTTYIVISELTSTSAPTYVQRRHRTESDTDPPTTTSPTVSITTITVTATSATSSSTAIPTKTGLKNCNVQGTANAVVTSNIWGSQYAADPLVCQLECMYISRCEAYSFQAPTTSDSNNCVLYTTLIDGSSKITLSNTSGVFFSDKYPEDGSNFCYGSTQL